MWTVRMEQKLRDGHERGLVGWTARRDWNGWSSLWTCRMDWKKWASIWTARMDWKEWTSMWTRRMDCENELEGMDLHVDWKDGMGD